MTSFESIENSVTLSERSASFHGGKPVGALIKCRGITKVDKQK